MRHLNIISRAGLRGGATGAITPAPPLQKVPRDEINVFQVKYTDLKNFCG